MIYPKLKNNKRVVSFKKRVIKIKNKLLKFFSNFKSIKDIIDFIKKSFHF